MATTSDRVRIAIIGAGIGGTTAAIALQKQLSFYDYEIYEMGADIGGTWRVNTYPGCECDVPSHWYSLSTDPNPGWSKLFSSQTEILAYWKHLVQKYDIGPHIHFFTEVVSAVWNEGTQQYTINLRDTRTNETRKVNAHVVISATGMFLKPKMPGITGREKYQGLSMHTADWDHTVEFTGKKVGIIGNGRSAVQVVPELSKNPTVKLVQFCRTPNWYIAKPQANTPDWMKWAFRNVPLCEKVFRLLLASAIDALYVSWKHSSWGTSMRHQREKESTRMVETLVPEKYHQNMIPNYPMGCKPNIIDPGYLASLQRENIELEWDPIAEVVETGILTVSGKTYELDIICYATGFDVEGSMSFQVTGIGAQTLKEYYEQESGPTAYMGITTPGFPNWFSLLGPNSVNEHASSLFVEEIQVNYAMQLIKPIIQAKAKSFVPNVWNGGCSSWYRAGPRNQGKLFTTWPGTLAYQWWVMRKPIWEDYDTIGGERWLRRKKLLSVLRHALALPGIGIALLGFWMVVGRRSLPTRLAGGFLQKKLPV